jgi:hypothetical protein
MKKQVICFIALCVAVAAGYFAWLHHQRSHIDLQKLFGGPENLSIVRSSDKVRIWKTAGFLSTEELSPQSDMSTFRKKGGEPMTVPGSMAKSFSEKLSNPSSYYSDSGSEKSCIPLPGFVVGFTRGDREIDVFLCFECDILLIQVGDTFKTEVDFDPSHNELLRVIKALYPNDDKVQALRERKRR